MKRRSKRGFSLLELMIVVAIVMILAAIAVPNLLRARQNAYEVSAVGFLHTVQAEQIAYRASHGSYATSFSQLPGLPGTPVDSNSASSANVGADTNALFPGAHNAGGPTSILIHHSYVFTLTPVSAEVWYCTGTPLIDRYYGQYLYLDETGFLRSVRPSTKSNSAYAQ